MTYDPQTGFGYPITGLADFEVPFPNIQYGVSEHTAESSIRESLVTVVRKAAAKLPGAVGEQLLKLIEPQSLGIVVAVTVVWASAQFYGFGEIADVALIVVGRIALGAAAYSAGFELLQFAVGTYSATSEADTDAAADHLVRAVSLIAIQSVLTILLRKPTTTFKNQYLASPGPPDPLPRSAFDNLPSNTPTGYKPSITGTRDLSAGEGVTSVRTGDIEYSLFGSSQDRQLAIAHELVHRFLTPKLDLLQA